MAERLWEVTEQLARFRVYLLGQETYVVAERDSRLERGLRLVELSGEGLCLGHPERAQQEGTLLALESILSEISVDKAAVVGQALRGGIDGRLHPWVVGCEKAHDRNEGDQP